MLLTTGAASADPPGEHRLIGTRAVVYRAQLRQWHRVAYDQHTAASLVLPYTVQLPHSPPILRQIETVIVVPRQFFGRFIANGTRSARLQARP
jgi:hypothetical protein